MRRRKRRGGGESSPARCMDAALRLLSHRSRTEEELRRRLAGGGFAADDVEHVCGRLKELRYVDDRAFAAAWAKARTGARCRSDWLIRRELRGKGIDAALAEEVVGEAYDGEQAFADACGLVRDRVRRSGLRDPVKLRARLQNLLLRRGFDRDFIRGVLATALGGGAGGEDEGGTDEGE
ncbi:MAG: RecX family transcriptional regulator [bacterium]|nr:RecX family transcriptional regulator [bacterium]